MQNLKSNLADMPLEQIKYVVVANEEAKNFALLVVTSDLFDKLEDFGAVDREGVFVRKGFQVVVRQINPSSEDLPRVR